MRVSRSVRSRSQRLNHATRIDTEEDVDDALHEGICSQECDDALTKEHGDVH
jgi:hypothetical protein